MAVKQIVLRPQSFRVALPAVPNTRYFTSVARSANIDLAQAVRLAEMKVEEFKALNPGYNFEIVKASAALPLVVPVDRAQGFEERLDEFIQKERARQRPSKPNRRAKQRM